MASSRRTFLKVGLGGGAVLALAGVGLALRPGADTPVPDGLLVLTPEQFRVLEAVADRICRGPGLPTAAEIGVAGKVDQQLATMHPADAAEFGQGLLLIENALVGLLFDGRTTPFTLLDGDAQDQVLDDFRTSSVPIRRSVFKALRGLVAASFWGDPRLYAHAGYPGPPDYAAVMAKREQEAADAAALTADAPAANAGATP